MMDRLNYTIWARHAWPRKVVPICISVSELGSENLFGERLTHSVIHGS